MPIKLLFHSNSPFATTGYGVQTALFCERLAKHYDLAISAFYGLDGSRLSWHGIDIYPGLGSTYGNELIAGHVRSFFGKDPRAGLVMTLMDVWVLHAELWGKFNVASWVPVDHDPVPPGVDAFFANTGAVPIAMSKWGQGLLERHDPLYCPHAVDTSVYFPRDKREARKKLGLPNEAFLVGVVAANKSQPSRKSYPEILQAFTAFRERHQDAMLYLHTDIKGSQGPGVDLDKLLRSLGVPKDSVSFVDQYKLLHNPIPPELMSYIYSAFDVLVNPARGEGFGVPILEAQACGVPAIVTDFSAMPEVCGAGWHCEGEPEWTYQHSWQMRPKVEDILDALEQCYRLPTKGHEVASEKARKHALAYDVEKVMEEHMLAALEEVTERFGITEKDEVAA